MGNRTIDVRSQVEPTSDVTAICGAMAEQCGPNGHHETESAPQKLLHLVGCRDPNARKKPWVRPRPLPDKV